MLALAEHAERRTTSTGAVARRSVLSVLSLCVFSGRSVRAQEILNPPPFRYERCGVSVTLRVAQTEADGPALVAGRSTGPGTATVRCDTARKPAGTLLQCTAEVGEEWAELAFTFSAMHDSAATIELGGGVAPLYEGAAPGYAREKYAIADDLVLVCPNGEIDVNGSFERGAPLPEEWRPRGQAAFGERPGTARHGRRYAVVSRSNPVQCRVSLAAGLSYTLRVWFRASREGCSRPAVKPPLSTVNVFVVPQPGDVFPLRPGRVLVGPGGVTKIRRGVDKEECLNFRSAAGLEWQEFAFRFSAEQDTTVSLELGGQWWPPRPGAPWSEWVQRYVFVDDVSVSCDGKPLEINGGFEHGGSSLADWRLEGEAAAVLDPAEAHSGARSAVVSYHHRAATRLSVDAGKAYEVRLWYRAKPDGLRQWEGRRVTP